MSTDTRIDRERLAVTLEREAALLRRPDFDITDARVHIDDDPRGTARVVSIRVAWDTGAPATRVDTWDDYHGRETDRTYDSVHVDGRYAHAYRSAHFTDEEDVWYLRVHETDTARWRERWVGGCVLADADSRGFLRMSREEAISAADLWAHHDELPSNAATH